MHPLHFLPLLAALLTACSHLPSTPPSKEYVHIPPRLPKEIRQKLQPGDCIIRKGNGPLSYHLMSSTKENYSHCGIIVRVQKNWKVVHTIGKSASREGKDGIQLMDLDEFVAHSADSTLYICRPVFADAAGNKVAERALDYLERAIPFDHRFNLFSTDKFYCSELLFHIFKEVKGENVFYIQKKHRSYLLLFATFFDKRKFQPVYHLNPDPSKWYSSTNPILNKENFVQFSSR